MACMLYARYNGQDIRLGRFKSRGAAEDFFQLWTNTLKSNGGKYPTPIYVETKKKRGVKI